MSLDYKSALRYYGEAVRYSSVESVLQLQEALGIVADGIVGRNTINAVASFQSGVGLTVDGEAGEKTWDALLPRIAVTPARGCGVVTLTRAMLERANAYNRVIPGITEVKTAQYQLVLTVDGVPGPKTAQAVAAYQGEQGIEVTGKLTSGTLDAMSGALGGLREVVISEQKMDRYSSEEVMEFTKSFEGGRGAAAKVYGATNRNMEYEGRWDLPKKTASGKKIPIKERSSHRGFKPFWCSKYHPSGGTMIGLSYGAFQGTQHGGTLGKICLSMYSTDRELFFRVFGGRERAMSMLKVLVSSSKPVRGVRSPRVQKVDGVDLWKEPWLGRFKEAATHEEFQRAQRDVIETGYLIPAMKTALELEIRDQASLSVMFDIAIQYGRGGLSKYVSRGQVRHAEARGTRLSVMEHVIASLPRSKKRRLAIYKAASPFVVYSAKSLMAAIASPSFPKERYREVKAEVRAF